MTSTGKLKIINLLSRVRQCLDAGRYFDTCHVRQRKLQRKISRPEILYVLRHGYHEKRKDYFDTGYHEWNYAICGKTPDGRELRVIVSFDNQYMLIITAIDLKV